MDEKRRRRVLAPLMALITLASLGLSLVLTWRLRDSNDQLRDFDQIIERQRLEIDSLKARTPDVAEISAVPSASKAEPGCDCPNLVLQELESLTSAGIRPTFSDIALMRELIATEDEDSKRRLIVALLDSPNPMIRLSSITELMEFDPENAIEEIRKFTDSIPSGTNQWRLSRLAVQSLADAPPILRDRELDRYFQMSDLRFKTPAAQAFAQTGNIRPMQELVDSAARGLQSGDRLERLRAVTNLERTSHALANEPLQRALRDSDPQVRRRATQALARTGDKDILPLVERMLEDPDPSVRQSAERVVGILNAEGDGE